MLDNFMKLANEPDDNDPFADDPVADDVDQKPANQKPEAVKPEAEKPAVPAKPVVDGKRPLNVLGKQDIGSRPYIIIELPDLSRSEFKQLESIADKFIDENTKNNIIPRWGRDDRGKKSISGIFKRRSPNENVIVLQANLGILFTRIFQKLTSLKFNTVPIANFLAESQAQIQQAAEQKPVTYQVDIIRDFKNPAYTNFADKDIIGIKVSQSDGKPANRELRDALSRIVDKNTVRSAYLEPGTAKFDGAEGGFIFHKVDPANLEKIAEELKAANINTSMLEERIAQYKKFLLENKDRPIDFRKIIRAKNVSKNTKMLISIEYPEQVDLRGELLSYLRFSFPTWANLTHDLQPAQNQIEPPEGMLIDDKDREIFYIYGSYDDMYKFGAMLKMTGWDVNEYRKIFGELLQSKNITPQFYNGNLRFTGALDGYEEYSTITDPDGNEHKVREYDEKGNPVYAYRKFYEDIDETVVPDVKLFDEQKNGVRWLYERNSAILGDDPGTGKTLSTLTAAAMRVKNGGKVLIVTMNNLKFQWAKEIMSKFDVEPSKIVVCTKENQKGIDELPYVISGDLSTDEVRNADWVIISYSNIGQWPKQNEITGQYARDNQGRLLFDKPRIKSVVDTLYGMNFSVVLVDESHNVKNASTASATVLADILPRIPFKWAASATTVANTPADIHNILKLTGHTLGQMSFARFKKIYVGSKPKIKDFNKADIEQKLEDLQKKAFELKKVLVLSGVFLSRSMSDINPNLPDHKISENDLQQEELDMDRFHEEYRAALAEAGPAAALGAMIKARVGLAKLKVPKTVEYAKRILAGDEGNKVLIFSNFIPCVNKIVSDLDTYLKSIDPAYDEEFEKVYKTERVLKISENDEGPNIQSKVDRFKDHDNPTRVMVISSKKGGTGLSLENSAGIVIMNDFDWSPSTAKQTEGRAFRINNISPVNTIYMLIRGNEGNPSLDEIFYKYVRHKIKVADDIQKLDQETQKIILQGLNGAPERKRLAEIQQNMIELEKQNVGAELDLNKGLNNIAQMNGEADFMVDLGDNAAQLFEDIEDFADQMGKDVEELTPAEIAKLAKKLLEEHDKQNVEEEKQEEQEPPADELNPKQASWYNKAKIAGKV